MLFDIQSKFEYFNSTLVDSDDVNTLVLVYLGLELEFCDEVCDHFEIQDCNKKIDHIA